MNIVEFKKGDRIIKKGAFTDGSIRYSNKVLIFDKIENNKIYFYHTGYLRNLLGSEIDFLNFKECSEGWEYSGEQATKRHIYKSNSVKDISDIILKNKGLEEENKKLKEIISKKESKKDFDYYLNKVHKNYTKGSSFEKFKGQLYTDNQNLIFKKFLINCVLEEIQLDLENGYKINWEDENKKYSIYYDFERKEFKIRYTLLFQDLFNVYFNQESTAKQALEIIKDYKHLLI